MPGTATHITVVQRLATSSPDLTALLGDPSAAEGTPENRRMRFANLGAVGPDIFYAMADYGRGLQDFENILIKVGGTFECISELMERLNRFITGVESEITFGISESLQQTFGLIQGVIKEWIVGLFVDAGFNIFPNFESTRQKDLTREQWFWADYLHYIRTGKFVSRLLQNSVRSRNPQLHAYALGYLTHYVTDILGHGYVNQVVQAPWRLYWQRHHLVENFIDAYVWDRWHVSRPAPPPPSLEEQPLDIVAQSPNAIGTGAPLTFARLHDHILVGTPTIGDPVDGLFQKVCDKINQGLFDLGLAEESDLPQPDDQDFRDWTRMMHDTIQEVYDHQERHPENLAPPNQPDGYPSPDDIGAAYGTLRVFLKFSTEEKIQEPQAPDILGDISRELKRFLDDLRNNLRRFPPPPLPSLDLSFSLSALWDAITSALKWLSDLGEWLGETVFDILADLIRTAGTVLSEPIKFLLWMLNKWLFSIYRRLRDTLVLAAYAVPFTEELSIPISANFNTSSLWRSMGDLASGQYPVEEILAERAFVNSNYAPMRQPKTQTNKVEQPPVTLTAPYRPHGDPDTGGVTPTLPGDFLDAPLGPDDMFTTGPEPHTQTGDPRAQNTFASDRREFGGVIANCRRAIRLAEEGSPLVSGPPGPPDYNLDGDRGWAWPSWDVEGAPTRNPDGSINAPDPLSPTAQQNSGDGIAHVNAVQVQG